MSALVNNAPGVRYDPQNAWNLDTPGTSGTGKATGTGGVGGAGTAAGAGSIAGVTAVPDAAAPTVMMAMMASVDAIMPKMGGDDLDALIASFTSKLKNTIDKSDKDQVKNEQDLKRGQIAEKKAKYAEAAKKIEDAKNAMEHASIGDKIKLAFQYLGAVLTIVAGIAAILASSLSSIVTGPAAVLGVIGGSMMIASGLIMLTMAADQTVSVATASDTGEGMGMFGRMIKACAKADGQSDEEADKMATKGAMGISIGLMVLAAVTGAVGMALQPEDAAFEAVGAVEDTMEAINEGTDMALEFADAGTEAEGVVDTGMEAEQGIDAGVEFEQAADVGSDTEQFGDLGENLENVEDEGQQGTGLVDKVARNANKAVKISNEIKDTGNAYATAATDITSAYYNNQAQDDQADANRAQADSKAIEALGKTLDDFIDMAIARLKASGDRFTAVVDSAMEAVQDRADTMARARFTG